MSAHRKWKNYFLKGIVVLVGGLMVLGGAAIIVYVLARGFRALSYSMIFEESSLLFGVVGLMPSIVNTLIMIFAATFIAMPFGHFASFILVYVKNARARGIMSYLFTVAGELPPVVYGLLGLLVFCQWMGFGVSVLAGTLTMSAMLMVEILSSSANTLTATDQHRQRQAASLGVSSGAILYTIVFPEYLPLTVAGYLRAMARVAAETITLLLTVGAGAQLAQSLATAFEQSGSTLSVMLYIYVQQRGDFDTGFAIAALLLLLIGVLIVGSNLCLARLKKR